MSRCVGQNISSQAKIHHGDTESTEKIDEDPKNRRTIPFTDGKTLQVFSLFFVFLRVLRVSVVNLLFARAQIHWLRIAAIWSHTSGLTCSGQAPWPIRSEKKTSASSSRAGRSSPMS